MERYHKEKEIPGLTREAEETMLAEILSAAAENLQKEKARVAALTTDMAELYESIEQEDKSGLLLYHDAAIRLRELRHGVQRFERACHKPYFGRIDFRDFTLPYPESYYVGKTGIIRGQSEPLVIDWRAPLASVYYENTLGKCRYTVSSEGTFEIDLQRKRTYEIEHDKLKDFYDSDVVANDDLLTRYLSRNRRAVLSEIIATIQQEQNRIIRRSPRTNLIVQGCAGSGKTTVAMHRISYILYNYADDFRPQDFYIVGSNRILLNYITGVLPDLDVYGVSQMTMEDLFIRLLYEDWDDARDRVRPLDAADTAAYCKGHLEWFRDLEAFCNAYEAQEIPRKEVCLEKTGTLLVGPQLIETYCQNNPTMSLQAKRLMLNEILLARFEDEVQGKGISFTSREQKDLRKTYEVWFGKGNWEGDLRELYRDFLSAQAAGGKSIPFPEDGWDVYDLAALAYLYKRIKEIDPVREASHVIIDEAQDFGMMAFSCLHYCLRNCTYTIMGDTSQNIHFGYGLNDWEELRSLLLPGPYDAFALLKKSYRNTVEIADFASGILQHGHFPIYPTEPILRHGSPVSIRECRNVRALLAETLHTLQGWQTAGYETLAVICRDEKECHKVAEELGKSITVCDGSREDTLFSAGIMVLPVSRTKGLEFDAVLLFNPSEKSYPATDAFVRLLYVAATRALHELTILHRGSLTPLIAQPPVADHVMECFAEGPMTREKEYEKPVFTEKELKEEERREGLRLMKEREQIGPDRLQAAPAKETPRYVAPQAALSKEINTSVHAFGDIAESSVLRPAGHSRIQAAIRWVKKEKAYVDLASSYGILRLRPVAPDLIRVSFRRGTESAFTDSPLTLPQETPVKWASRESSSQFELSTGVVRVRINKKDGALQFLRSNGSLLLAEKAAMPRQLEDTRAWIYFDWGKNEKLKARGRLKTDLLDVSKKARYISHGGRSLRMPYLVSSQGYELGIACTGTVLCCAIPMYGPYLYAEGNDQIDYYFHLL